jgi:predicted aminopeptidase
MEFIRRKNTRRLLGLAGLLLMFFLYQFHSELDYGWAQLKGQLKVISKTKSIEQLKAEGYFNDNQLLKLKFIEQIKLFAKDSLGMNPKSNYTTFYNDSNSVTLWMVSASEPFEFKAVEWSFPLAGSFDYIGFFDTQRAVNEVNKLKQRGYDVELSRVAAWSTLGILSDPVLGSMLQMDYGKLAELLFHELSHGVIYKRNNVDWNENFATLTGRAATLSFMLHYGKEYNYSIEEYKSFLARTDSLEQFNPEAMKQLQEFYQLFCGEISEEEKYKAKETEMNEIIARLIRSEWTSMDKRIKIAARIRASGNAYFLSANRYSKGDIDLEELKKEVPSQLYELLLKHITDSPN